MPPVDVNLQRTPQSRIFTINGGAGPSNRPDYASLGRALGVTQSFGDVTPVRVPSPDAYDKFDVVEVIQAQEDLPTMSIEFLKKRALSAILKAAKARCPIDIQVHVGACKNPSDFDRGYELVGILENARATNYATDDLGAMDGDANAVVMETVDFTALGYYEVAPVTAAKQADSTITDEIIRVIICDSVTCASCGIASDGTNIVFALQAESSGSPGIGAKIIWTKDGGLNWSVTFVSTTSIGESVVDLVCQGPYLVVLAAGSADRIHYCLISEFLKGTATWTAVSTGFVAAGSPLKFVKYDAETVFIPGEGGYCYLMTSPPVGVTVLMSGSVSTNNLLAGSTQDGQSVLLVGASNTILYSANGGSSFASITGPSANTGINATAALCVNANTFFVGYENGTVYYTIDGGLNWTAANMTTLGRIYCIERSTDSVLWIGGRTAANAATILRSINGGYSFVPIEQINNAVFPSGRLIQSIAATADDPNTIFAGGLATDLNDGILLKVT